MSRKRRRMKIIKTLAFILVLAALIFVGYSVAQSISRLNDPNYKPKEPSSSESSILPPEESSSESSGEPKSPISEPEPQNTASDIRSIPVSYTHLDVYKRQGQRRREI